MPLDSPLSAFYFCLANLVYFRRKIYILGPMPKKATKKKSKIHGLIKSQRIAMGLTQQQVANKLETHVTAVSHWEIGISEPRSAMIPRLAAVLEVEVGFFYPKKQKKAG